ncbi:MAG: hypothetical protein LQ351_000774 [Letrouitia transgressa]|nr:MAG: hypothetical protein LQ351_000774 [Letrouitia transgressa]
MGLLPRYYDCPDDYYYGGDGYCYRNRSNWDRFGRWILVGIIIVGALFIALAFACITARRRRRRGLQPYRGTGWAAGGAPPGQAPAQWTGNQYNPNQPGPPNYGPPPNQGYYGNNQPNQGYYGGQQSGVAAPNNVYQPQGGDQVYSPPSGPPPTKEGVIR